jgi:hypothetical protein
MFQAQKFSAVRRPLNVALICAGLISSPFVLSAVSAPAAAATATAVSSTATSNGTNAYFNIRYSGTPNWVRLFIDTDRVATSGFPVNGIGADYMVENGRLYRYTGNNGAWNWTFVKTVTYTSGNGSATITVARADMGSPTAINAVAQIEAQVLPVIRLSLTTTTPTPTPAPTPTATVPVNYTASTATIANPERGFYRHVGCETPLSLSQLTSFRTSGGETLMLCVFYLRPFVNSPISQASLNLFQAQMDTVRNAGLKAIVRFAYNDANNPADATPAMVNTHLTQLAPYLAANKDIISVVQAGLIGSWGEWGNTSNYGDSYNMTAKNIADRKSVVDKLLAVVPAERAVQLRMPLFKTKLYSPTALTSAEAFTGTAKARLGFHNDCFLSNSSDYGTYINPSVEYPYLEAETNFVPSGGETCAYTAPRSDCPTALSVMSQFHWSYLNLDYNVTVLDKWRSQGCFAQVEQKLGYRLALKSGAYSSSAKPGGAFTVNLQVQNTGWAAPFNARNVELVFRNTASGALYRVKLATDPRRWTAGQTTTVSQTVTLPANMVKGTYALLLNLPDPQASLSNRPEYSIQLANNGTWEASTGFNNLNHAVGIAP